VCRCLRTSAPEPIMNTTEERAPSFFSIPLVLVFVGLVCFGALLGRQRELTVLSFLVLGLMGAARLWGGFAPRRMTCDLSVQENKLFPGESVVLNVTVKNHKLLPVHFRLQVPSSDILRPAPDQPATEQSGGLLWFQQVRFCWTFTAQKRGVHTVGPPRLAAGDLLGYYPREMKKGGTLRIIVFPRLVPVRPFRFSQEDLFGVAGGTGIIPDPVYIVGTRDYQAWRPARHIHWKASVRHRRLQEKVYEPSRQEKMLFIVHADGFSGKGGETAFERTLEVVASLAVRLEREGHQVGLATNASSAGDGPAFLSPAGSPKQLATLLEILAGMKPVPSGSLFEAVQETAHLPWGTSCLLFSHDNDEEAVEVGKALSRRRVPAALVLCREDASGGHPKTEEGQRTYTLADFCNL
jgi:uncharacterized protein (DUF58 family)